MPRADTPPADPVARRSFLAGLALGALVVLAEKSGRRLDALTLEDFRSASDRFESDVHAIFDLDRAMTRRNLAGAPGNREVRRQLARWRRTLGPSNPASSGGS